MTFSKIHFSSEKQDWSTPKDFFEKYNKNYNFTWDLACTTEDCLVKVCGKPCGYCIDIGEDSLKQDWYLGTGWQWCNPPYGRGLKEWVKKAYEESLKGANIVMLIPSRTDTSYWHSYIFGKENVTIEFIKGRLKFGGSKNSAPFPSAIIEFKGIKNEEK